MTAMPPVLVTGASGFIGRVLLSRLKSLGHPAAGVDLLGDGDAVVRGDVRVREDLVALMPEGGWVFHLAGVVGVVEVLERPHETFETSVRGTARILELAAGRNCRVILASSSEVYGNIRTTALREDRPLPASYGSWPRASYPEGKREAERLLLEFTRSGGDGRIARLFNVSGPGQAWESGMVLPTFVHHALMDLPLPLIGHGRDLRCFQHVEDAVSGLCLLAGSDSARGRIVNLGSQESIEIRRLAARVLAVLGRKVPLVPVSSRDRYGATATRCAQRVPDLERCRRLLGHRAALGLDRIILDIATSRAAVDTGPRAGRDRAVG